MRRLSRVLSNVVPVVHKAGLLGAAALALGLLSGGAAHAATIQVNSTSTKIANDGLCTLREAVTSLNNRARSGTAAGECAAGNGSSDMIQLMTSTQTYNVSVNLVINRSVHIVGYGTGVSVIRTTAGRGFDIADLNTSEAGPEVAFSNLTIENGRTDSNTVYGVYFNGGTGSPRLIFNYVNIRNCTNGVHAQGGGDALNEVRAYEFRVENSKADGFYCRGCTANLTRATIIGSAGSGVRNRSLSADGWPYSGVVLEDSTVENNGVTSVNGGGIRTEGGGSSAVNLRRSTVSNNRGANGGGIYSQGSLIAVYVSTISSNTAANGGGVYVDLAPTGGPTPGENNFYDTTIAANIASVRAGGIFIAGRQALLINTILGDNVDNGVAPKSPDCKGEVSVFDTDSNDMIENTTGCVKSGTTSVPPWRFQGDLKLGPLVPSGAIPNIKVHVPLKGSPVINTTPPGDTPDARQMPRPEYQVNGSGTVFQGTLADAGAVEYNTVWDKVNLQVTAASDGISLWDSDGYFRLGANATGDYVTYAIPVSESGIYDVTGHIGKARDGGNYRLECSNSPSGPWVTIVDQDQYTSSTTPVKTALTGAVTIPASGTFVAGLRYFRFRALGKNASATGYLMRLSYLKVQKR